MARGKRNKKKNGKLQKEVKKIEKVERMALPAAVDNVVRSRPARVGIPGRNGGRRGKRKRRSGGLRGQFAGGERVTLTGREYLSAVNITSTQQIGDTLFSGTVSPQSITGSRLQVFAGLYERWKLKKWRVTYIPEVGTSTGGNLVLYYEPDPTDFIPNGQVAIAKALSAKGVDFPVYSMQRPSITAKVEKEFTNLYTTDSEEIRMSQAGLIILFANFTSTFGGTTTVGQLVLDYEIEFFKPLLELNAGSLSFACSTVSVVGMAAATMFGTGFIQTSGNTLEINYISNQKFSFQPRAAGDIYLMVIRMTGATALMQTPLLSTTDSTGAVVTTNYSLGALSGSSASFSGILIYNFTAPDGGLLTVSQVQTLTNSPTAIYITIVRCNNALNRKKKATQTEKRLDQVEDLLRQILDSRDSSFTLISDSPDPVQPVPVEELIKKYLSDKK